MSEQPENKLTVYGTVSAPESESDSRKQREALRAKRVPFWEIFWTFLVIGATSFGGGVVAYLRNALVTRKRWLDEAQFFEALEISQALPGLNATNMAVIVGDRLRGPIGAAVAFFGICIPGAVLVFVLGYAYAGNPDNPHVNAALKGIGAASVGLLAAVTLQIGHKQMEHLLDISIVALTVYLISFAKVPLGIVLVTVGPLAIFLYRPKKGREFVAGNRGTDRRPTD